jgi:hypothetical protein
VKEKRRIFLICSFSRMESSELIDYLTYICWSHYPCTMGSHKMCVAKMSKQRVYVTLTQVTTDVIVIKCVSAISKQKSYLTPRELMTKVIVIKCVFLKYQNKELFNTLCYNQSTSKKIVCFCNVKEKRCIVLNTYLFISSWIVGLSLRLSKFELAFQ